jgi:hypothetical protein
MPALFDYPSVQWWLHAIVEVDREHPGLAGALMRASDHRKQVSAAVLAAHGCVAGKTNAHGKTAELDDPNRLLTERFDTLIGNVYGTSSRQFISMLNRMGGRICEPRLYRRLHRVYAEPTRPDVIEALRVIESPTERLLDIAEGCPEWVLRTGALPLLESGSQRDALLASVELIREVCPSADEKAIFSTLRAAAKTGDISRFSEHWLRRAQFPEVHLQIDASFSQIRIASELRRWARQFRNCSPNYRLEVLAGVSAIFICGFQSNDYMVHIKRAASNAPWEYAGAHSPDNGPTPLHVREFVKSCMRDAGVLIPRDHLEVPDKWKPIQRLSMPFELDGYLFDLEG